MGEEIFAFILQTRSTTLRLAPDIFRNFGKSVSSVICAPATLCQPGGGGAS
jgi:hypothetical protein